MHVHGRALPLSEGMRIRYVRVCAHHAVGVVGAPKGAELLDQSQDGGSVRGVARGEQSEGLHPRSKVEEERECHDGCSAAIGLVEKRNTHLLAAAHAEAFDNLVA